MAHERGQPEAHDGDQSGKHEGWLSEADQRALVVVFAGTVAANLLTVLLVGGAIAFIHYLQPSSPKVNYLPFMTAFSILALVVYAAAWLWLPAPIRKQLRSGKLHRWHRFFRLYFWVPLAMLLLILIGTAAGIK